MKRFGVLTLSIFVLGILVPNLSFSLDLYDDFSGGSIDRTKWRETELVREVRNFSGNNKLFSETASPSPVRESSFPYIQRNILPFSNPSTISSFQAEVTVLGSDVTSLTGSAVVSCVYLGGTFYNDGTPGGGTAGNIFPQIMIYKTSTHLGAQYSVLRYTTADGNTYTHLDTGNFTTPIIEGTPYTLSISYDGDKQFTFKVGTETLLSDPSKLPAWVSGPSQDIKGLLTAVVTYTSSDTASVSATFDDVYINGALYDDFSSSIIDQTKWSAYELVTEITGGKLRSKVRTESTSQVNNVLEMAYPLGIKAIQAQVTPLVYSNPQGLYVDASISGTFFNDGTPGTGFAGDIYAKTYIGGNGVNPQACWQVLKLDSAGNSTQVLDQGVFNTPIVLGSTYTLYLEWNGTAFTFRINDEVAHSFPTSYVPAVVIHPVKHPMKRLRTTAQPQTGKTDATVEALFDDVYVSYFLPNDDFSGVYIDGSKWSSGEFVREIDPGSGRLIMKYASPNPVGITSFPYNMTSNNLTFDDPNTANPIQADVALLNYDLRNNAYTRARIGGRWYNDGSGTPGTDMTGDIWAEVDLRADPSGLYGQWSVARYTNASGSTSTTLSYGNFTTPIAMGTTYTLYLGYDQGLNKFTFRITPVGAGPEELTFGPIGLPARVRDPNIPWKGLGNRVQINDDSSYGYVSAAFDNVLKNGALYDDFSSPTIDPAKWTAYEMTREISGGKLRSRIRSSSESTSSNYNNLNFLNPSSIGVFQAKVTPVTYQNPQGEDIVARLGGRFYNDGTPGGGYLGEVGAEVRIGGTGTSPVGQWDVWTYNDTAGNNTVGIISGVFAKPIVLGNTYTLLLKWDGSKFTFMFDDESAYYTPGTSINPPRYPWKALVTRVKNPTGHEALIEALFDDVRVNFHPDIVDFDGDQKTDITIYRGSTGAWFIIPSMTTLPYGVGFGGDPADFPVPGDYDGDGQMDLAIYRKSTGAWFIYPSSTGPSGIYGVGFGGDASDIPVPADYDGDGQTDLAIYRASTGAWFIYPSSKGPSGIYGVGFGGDPSDIPVPADYDGDGKTDLAIYRASTGAWFIYPSSTGSSGIYGVGFGGDPSDIPVPGDYDGDGKADLAIFRPSLGAWFIWPSSTGSSGIYGVGFGAAGDIPVPGDYDGDGRTDMAIFRPSIYGWFIWPSSIGASGIYGVGFGGDASDIPLTTNFPSIY